MKVNTAISQRVTRLGGTPTLTRVVRILIESGLIYCLAAVSTAPATITLSADAITRGQIITSILFVVDNNGVYIIADMLIDLTVRPQPPALHIISY